MICPMCSENIHRSHSRSLREILVKKITNYKTYRCGKCGWRGMAAPAIHVNKKGRLRTIVFWILGVLIALGVGAYAIYDLQSTAVP